MQQKEESTRFGVKIVEPRDEVSTQANRAPVVMNKSNGKRKMEMEEKIGDSDNEDKETKEFEDGWISEVSEDYSYEKGSDEDYDPVKNDDDVAKYEIDDDDYLIG
ncbi:hypothetical protein ACLB2K_063571 [Fragaria x ananassa]